MTPDQMRMARAKLGLSQTDVAERIGLTHKTLSNAEAGTHNLNADNLDRLRTFYVSRGLEFIDHNGVRETPTGLRTYRGQEGFRDFYEDQFAVIKAEGGDLWLYNGVSQLVIDALGKDYVEKHKTRMSKIKNHFRYRVIVEEGDETMFGADYAHYRWVPKEQFNEKTLFVYGPYFAVVNFEGDISVVAIEQREVADTLRRLMENSWGMAKEPHGDT